MEPDGRSWHTELEFNAPLSSEHARELIATLRVAAGEAVVDLGCGWAELLLRLAEQHPVAHAVGVDRDPAMIDRARRNAEARGLGGVVRLEQADATEWSEPVDVAVVVGSSHAWGGTRAVLDALRPLVRGGGRLLLGDGIWERPPTPAALAALGAQPDEFTSLADLVDLCVRSGFRLLAVSTASAHEWETFESRYCASRERWLLEHPEASDADEIRAEIDAHRTGWLEGYRGVLGFAYLTLAVPASR